MSEIDLVAFTELFGLDRKAFWHPYRCKIDEYGVLPQPIDDLETDLLIGDEWLEILKARRDLTLRLPCTHAELAAWAERNGFADALPEDFIANTQERTIPQSLQKFNLPKCSELDMAPQLNAPSRQDSWFDEISDMTTAFHAEFGTLPKKSQAGAVGVSKDKFEHAETTEWKSKAWTIGETWMKERRQKGEDPGVIDIAKYVEGELSNQKITGRRGKFLDWETIKREALKGITGKPANGKGQKRRKLTGESPATKSFPQ